jgi:hypothetical protein
METSTMFKKACHRISSLVSSRPALAGAVAAVGTSLASAAHATGIVDYSTLVTSATTEMTSTLTTIVPFAGTLLAVGIGWKLVRRFTK